MFVLKLDEEFFAVLNEDDGWEYTDKIEDATPLDPDVIATLLEDFKEEACLTIGTSDFYDISILELELMIKKEIKVKAE